jgi:glucosamine kinase
MTSEPAYAVVDGGKSSLRMRVTVGHEVRDGLAGGFQYSAPVNGVDGIDTLTAAIAAASKATAYDGRLERVTLGLTGAPADRTAERRLALAAGKTLNAMEVVVVSDALMAHAGALGGPGVVVTAGTGAVAVALDGTGRTARADGWGYLIGDRGGGFWIGRAGLVAAFEAADGSGPPTLLEGSARTAVGDLDIPSVQRLLADPRLVASVAGFAEQVTTAALAADEVALEILTNAAAHLARTASIAADKLGLRTSDRVVSYSGRALERSVVLRDLFSEAVRHRQFDVAAPRGDALAGGLLLARNPSGSVYPTATYRIQPTEGTELCEREQREGVGRHCSPSP